MKEVYKEPISDVYMNMYYLVTEEYNVWIQYTKMNLFFYSTLTFTWKSTHRAIVTVVTLKLSVMYNQHVDDI